MKNILFMIVFLTVSGSTNISYGQTLTLSDWKNALSNAKDNLSRTDNKWAGLNSIPYDDIRESAKSAQSKLKDLMEVPHGCEPTQHGTKKLRQSIKDLEGHLSDATNESDKTKIEETINDKKEELEDMINKDQIRADYSQKIVDARREVREQVDYAIEKAKDESDPDIKPIAQELIAHWEDDRRNHAMAILDEEAAVRKCKACAEGDQ